MKRSAAVVTLGASLLLIASAGTAGAAPNNSQSPNLEKTFPVVCDGGVTYTLLDAPAAGDHADFTPAFVVGSNQVVVPYSFEATQTAVVLTDGAVIDGTTYNAGDILFSGSESTAIGTQRHGGRACTFGGSGGESFPDDNGLTVEIAFTFEGVALAIFPNSR